MQIQHGVVALDDGHALRTVGRNRYDGKDLQRISQSEEEASDF